jgi:hypothetical protein
MARKGRWLLTVAWGVPSGLVRGIDVNQSIVGRMPAGRSAIPPPTETTEALGYGGRGRVGGTSGRSSAPRGLDAPGTRPSCSPPTLPSNERGACNRGGIRWIVQYSTVRASWHLYDALCLGVLKPCRWIPDADKPE